jgi:AraC-like DNA-binding protein
MSSPSTSAPSIASITARISELSLQISSYIESTSHPEPSFDVSSAAVPETADYEALRAPLNDAALDLLRLINGPRRDIRTKSMSHFDHAAYQIALDRRFFDLVPLPPPNAAKDTATADAGSGESVKKIAQQAGMDEDRTARVFRMLATQRIFEKVPGEVESYRHTAASALFAQDKDLHAFYDMQ